MTTTANIDEESAAVQLGAALRAARLRSGKPVTAIAARFRGGDRAGTANSYMYDAEKGRRLASHALVEAYAETCDAPQLLTLRSEMDEVYPAGPYAVLRRLEERFGFDEASEFSPEPGDRRIASELPMRWSKLAAEFETRNLGKRNNAESLEQMVCHGRLESSLLVARLLSWAAKSSAINGTVVIVSSDGDALYDPDTDDVLSRDASAGLLHGTLLFRCIVECLLSRGIDVVHIRPEAETAAGAKKQIDALVQLLGYPGEYLPKNLGRIPAEPSHSILVPGVAVVQFMAASSPYCDSVMVTPRHCEAQYRLLASHIEGISRRREPVAAFIAAGAFNQPNDDSVVPGDDLFGFLRAVRQIDAALEELDTIEGERDAFKGGLIAVTCPIDQLAERRRRFWEERRDGKIDGIVLALLSDLDGSAARRRDGYVRNLSRYRHTDVVTLRSIETFVRTGLFEWVEGDDVVAFPDDYLGLDVPTPTERAGHLRSIVSDLLDYPQYELLLVSGDELKDLRGSGWAVKAHGPKGDFAFFEAIRTRPRKRGGIAQSYAAWRVGQLPLIDQIARYAAAECARLRTLCPVREDVIAYLRQKAEACDEMASEQRAGALART